MVLVPDWDAVTNAAVARWSSEGLLAAAARVGAASGTPAPPASSSVAPVSSDAYRLTRLTSSWWFERCCALAATGLGVLQPP